jgi:hypothetical protein
MGQGSPEDLENSKVLEILVGAKRGNNDPDTRLAEMLPRLVIADDSLTYEAVLEQLIRDAD